MLYYTEKEAEHRPLLLTKKEKRVGIARRVMHHLRLTFMASWLFICLKMVPDSGLTVAMGQNKALISLTCRSQSEL